MTRLSVLLAVAGATAAGLMIALAPTLLVQLLLVGCAAVLVLIVTMTRSGRVLNPAWIIVGWLYLAGPLDSYLSELGVGVSPAALLILVPVPFVLAALLLRPRSVERLELLTPLLLLAVLAGLSLWWSTNPVVGASKLTLWITTGLVPAACVLLLAESPQRVSWRLVAVAGVVFAMALLAFGAEVPLTPGRATIFDINPIWAGRAAFVAALVALFGPVPAVIRVVVVPLAAAGAIATGSLGPVVGFAVGVIAGVAEILRARGLGDRRVVLAWVGLVLVAGLAVSVLLSGALDPILSDAAADPNNADRVTLLVASARLFAGSPILGVGFGGFAATGLDLYPHNLVAEIAGELGVAGLILLAAWLLLALRGAARSPLLVALVMATATFALFSGNVAGNLEFWLLSALAVAMIPAGARNAGEPAGGHGSMGRP